MTRWRVASCCMAGSRSPRLSSQARGCVGGLAVWQSAPSTLSSTFHTPPCPAVSLPPLLLAGSLGEEAATPALNACLEGLYAALRELPPVVGTVTLRLEVAGDTGHVRDLEWLANTLVARPQGGEEPWEAVQGTLATIAQHCLALRLPPSSDRCATAITLPFVFE